MDHTTRLALIRRVQLAFAVTRDAVTQASKDDVRPGSADAAPYTRPLVLQKVVAELSMLLGCVRGVSPSLTPTVDEIARELGPLARGFDHLARLCQEPALALDHAMAHIHLAAIGYPDEHTDRVLELIVREHSAGSPERLPFRDLESEWLQQMWRGSSSAPSPELLGRTCVARPLDALASTTTDLYIFTHVILHATDMGRRAVSWPRSEDAVVADAEAGIAAAIDADNFDLTTELLWAWPMMGLEWSPTATFAFDLLTAAQDEYGFLPGPEWSADTASELAIDERTAYCLRTSYHANLVMGLLCAAILRRGTGPFDTVRTVCGHDRFDDAMQAVINHGRLPRWQLAIAALDHTRQDTLVELVLTIAIRRASHQHDFDQLRRCLSLWLRLDLPHGPAVDQCLALLRRATMVACLGAGTT